MTTSTLLMSHTSCSYGDVGNVRPRCAVSNRKRIVVIKKLITGIPRSFRMMQGFGVNTYTLLNDKGERYFVKFHLIPELGVHSLVWDEALKLSGQDPGLLLYKAIYMS
jgi:catalase